MLCQDIKMCHHLQYLHFELGICSSGRTGAGVAMSYLVVPARPFAPELCFRYCLAKGYFEEGGKLN